MSEIGENYRQQKDKDLVNGLLGASPEPATIKQLSEWSQLPEEQIKERLRANSLEPLTLVDQLRVELRTAKRELEMAQKPEPNRILASEKERNVQAIDAAIEKASKDPESVSSKYTEPVYGLTDAQYQEFTGELGDDAFMEYRGKMVDSALSKIPGFLDRK